MTVTMALDNNLLEEEQHSDHMKLSIQEQMDNSIMSADNSSRPTCSRRRVQFDEKIETIPVQNDLRLRKEKWYGKTDYKRFHKEKKETLRHFRTAQAKFQGIDETIYCLRGFEACLSARAVQQKLLRKVAAVQAVMEIQFRQRERRHRREKPATADNDNHIHNNHHHQHHYHHDARKLQTEYYRVTTPSRNQAIERAALDAREVREAQAQDQQEQAAATDSASVAFTVSAGASSSTAGDMLALKNEFDRLLAINAVGGPLHPTLRSATSGPLRLCKTVPNTA